MCVEIFFRIQNFIFLRNQLENLIQFVFYLRYSGETLTGLDGAAAAQKLRGRVGTTVTVKIHSVMCSILYLYKKNSRHKLWLQEKNINEYKQVNFLAFYVLLQLHLCLKPIYETVHGSQGKITLLYLSLSRRPSTSVGKETLDIINLEPGGPWNMIFI